MTNNQKALLIDVKGLVNMVESEFGSRFPEQNSLRKNLKKVNSVLKHVINAAYEEVGERLQEEYVIYCPPDTSPGHDSGKTEEDAKNPENWKALINNLTKIIDSANFVEIPTEEIEKGLEMLPDNKLRLSTSLADFEWARFFCRGSHYENIKRPWYEWMLRKEPKKRKIYDQLIIIAKERSLDDILADKPLDESKLIGHLKEEKLLVKWYKAAIRKLKKKEEKEQEAGLEEHIKKPNIITRAYQATVGRLKKKKLEDFYNNIHIGFYQNVGENNLEYLFPNPKFKLNIGKKLWIAATGGGTISLKLVPNLIKTAGKSVGGLLTLPVTIAAGSVKMVVNYFTAQSKAEGQRLQYVSSTNCTKDSKAISTIIDEAELSDQREMILGYHILLSHLANTFENTSKYTPPESDGYMEQHVLKWRAEDFLKKHYEITERQYDFPDVVDMMLKAGIATTMKLRGRTYIKAVEPSKAFKNLKKIDDFLIYYPQITEREQDIHEIFYTARTNKRVL